MVLDYEDAAILDLPVMPIAQGRNSSSSGCGRHTGPTRLFPPPNGVDYGGGNNVVVGVRLGCKTGATAVVKRS